MRRLFILLVVVAACGDDKKPNTPDDAGIDAAADAAIDAPVDAPPGRLTGCLDRPGDVPMAPNGKLPCDLVPPGLAL